MQTVTGNWEFELDLYCPYCMADIDITTTIDMNDHDGADIDMELGQAWKGKMKCRVCDKTFYAKVESYI